MLKAFICAILLTVFAAVNAEPAPMTDNFVYKGKLFRVTITKYGSLYGGKLGETPVFSSISVMGSYEHPGEQYDDRMFQEGSKDASSTLESVGENRFRIVSKGTVGNARFPEAAVYEQTTALEPERILIVCKVTAKIPMSARSSIFCNIMAMPVSAMVDRGIMIGENQVISAPAKCERGKGMKHYSQKMKISYPDGIFRVTAGWKTVFCLTDCRSWGENQFRLDGSTSVPWKHNPETYPAGKVWEWTMEYSFLPHDD